MAPEALGASQLPVWRRLAARRPLPGLRAASSFAPSYRPPSTASPRDAAYRAPTPSTAPTAGGTEPARSVRRKGLLVSGLHLRPPPRSHQHPAVWALNCGVRTLSHGLSPLPAVPFPHPDGTSSSCFIATTSGAVFMKPSQTPPPFSEQDPPPRPRWGTSHLIPPCGGRGPALVAEPVRRPEKEPAWTKQSQEAERGWIP